MAPPSQKRRRDEDVRQPKKKKPFVKKQKVYHSSSEDESDDETPRARDAPIREKRPPTPAKPKSILKQTPQAESEDESEEEPDEELIRNTALNTAPGAGGDQAKNVESEDEEMEDGEPTVKALGSEDEDEDEDDDFDSDSDAQSTTSGTSANAIKINKKRNDPAAFATSISKILETKLSSSKRVDPVLSRSKSAADANKALADAKLEKKARAQIRSEKRTALQKGRVKDVLGLETEGADTGKIVEEEKRLKKTAQRGVVKLFNAVRAAQVKAEEAMKQAKNEGVIGMQKREEKVNEMSKQGFLDLISSGGKTAVAA
ncbi:Hypothetical protein R9X50_00676900 [Acrodontium crateriforme]|uniref:Rrp15p-domain-containing protein n=1 Tax=Acrodontium crateriforme TaxID=150365 RepID=A0AAQ3RBS3_9PEZI|nr:Hypothetical protein R9X50_00676900 [Acrodontium crateriforme]